MSESYESRFDRTDIINCSQRLEERLDDEEAHLLDSLASGYETLAIEVYGTDPLHFGYFDKSTRGVNNSALMRIQEEGYALLHAGKKRHPGAVTERVPFVEAKPRAYYEENYWG